MIAKFVEEHLFMCVILLFGVCSIFIQWIMSLSLKDYVKASANMKTTKKKVMLNLKNQFETIYDMDYKVRNVSAYVDKYLLKLRFLGITFSAWEKMPALSAGITTLMAGGMAFYTYNTKGSVQTLVEILFSYAVVLACLFLSHHILGIKSKKQQIQIQLVDYLENYLTNRVMRNQESSKDLTVLPASEEKESSPVEETEKQIAASKEPSDIELLEEFVQSFLA